MISRLLRGAKGAYYIFRDRHGDWRRVICAVRGHEYPTMLAPACCLYFCQCCGRELCGRTLDEIDNLAPMTDEIRQSIDDLEEYDRRESAHA